MKEQITYDEQIGANKRSTVHFVGGEHVEVALTPTEFAGRINAPVGY